MGGVTNSFAQQYRPKYLRENDRSLLDLTSLATEQGWLEFRPEGPVERVNPDNFFTRFSNSIGLSDGYQMRLIQDETDPYRIRHQRYQLFYRNIEVEGVEYSLHSRNQQLETAHGRIVENLAIDVTRFIPELEALTAALTDIRLSLAAFVGKELPKGKLLIARTNGQETISQNFRLCYAFDVRPDLLGITLPGINLEPQRVYVDAVVGQVVRRDPLIHKCFHIVEQNQQEIKDAVRPFGPDNLTNKARLAPSTFVPRWGRYQQADLTFETEPSAGQYRLSAYNGALLTRRAVNTTGNWANNPDVLNGSADWGTNEQNATTAHWLTQRVHQFFSRWQNGYNQQGAYPRILVNYSGPRNPVNAFWNGVDQLAFGFAPISSFNGNPNFSRTLLTADILGHEYAHAVTQFSANLEYVGESGALNESISDIFGTAFERYLLPNDWNWDLAEDSYQIRDMANPRRAFPPFEPANGQPQIYQGPGWEPVTGNCNDLNDACGVHINSGVMNKWFHTLCTGQGPNGQNITGIAFDDATSIVYRALRYYLQRTSNYYDMAPATSAAAGDLFLICSPQQRAVRAAWRTVGIEQGSCPIACDFQAVNYTTASVNCNQPLTLNAGCNGGNGFTCTNLSYQFTGPNVPYNFAGSSLNVTAPSNPGTYQYSVLLFKNNATCYAPSTTFNVNVNCGTTNLCDFSGGPRRVGSWNGLEVQIRSISGKNVLVTAVSGSPTDKYYPRGNNFWDSFQKDGGVDNLLSCLNAGDSGYGGLAFPGGISAPPGYQQGSESDGAIYFELGGGSGGSCDFNISANANNANPTCNTPITLNANCSGNNCDVSYTWSGNGINQSGQSISINAPGSNGNFTYTVTANRGGCNARTATVNVNVSGCGGGTPPPTNDCIESESVNNGSGSVYSDGNASGGQGKGDYGNSNEGLTYSANVSSGGNYTLKLRYATGENPTAGIVVNNGGTQSLFLPHSGGPFSYQEQSLTVNLNAGSNTIRVQGGAGGAFRQDRICLTSGSGRLATTEISGERELLSLHLFPNPNTGRFQATMKTIRDKKYTLEVNDLQGKTLFKKEVTGKGGSQTETVELTESYGMVVVSVQSEGKRVSKRLLIQK